MLIIVQKYGNYTCLKTYIFANLSVIKKQEISSYVIFQIPAYNYDKVNNY